MDNFKKMDPKLSKQIRSINIENLSRKELGVLSFESVKEALTNYYEYLLFFINSDTNKLSQLEQNSIEQEIKKFIQLVDKISNFNPRQSDNASTHSLLIGEITSSWETASNKLRQSYTYLQLFKIDFIELRKKADNIISESTQNVEQIKKHINELNNFKNNFSGEVSEQVNRLQDRINTTEKNFQNNLENLKQITNSDINKISEEAQKQINALVNHSSQSVAQLSNRVDEVDKKTQKFAAQKTLTTYSKIFSEESENNIKLAKSWRRALFLGIFLEIVAAISLTAAYLPVISNTKDNVSLIVSIIFLKVFVLSAIGVFIAFALKHSNAQNHLAATNKFKANALASFEAFIEATNDPKKIDDIILHVSKAIYSSGPSGYLSKDNNIQAIANATNLINELIKK